jgi:hypothetical protein
MLRLEKLWRSISIVGSTRASRCDWVHLLDPEWPHVEKLFRSTGTTAASVWCPSPGGDKCPRRVIDHGRDRIVAVCADPEVQCDHLDLVPQDVMVFEFNLDRLSGSLAQLLGLNKEPALPRLADDARTVGWFEPVAGERFPVCLAMTACAEGASSIVMRLSDLFDRPFLLILPTRDLVPAAMSILPQSWQVRLLFLAEILAFDDTGGWVLQLPSRQLLQDFRSLVVRDQDRSSLSYRFPTRPGTRWEDIMVRFITQDDVEVRAPGYSQVYHFAHLGLGDDRRRPSQPAEPWRLLLRFAAGGGRVTWTSTADNRRLAKHKEKLRAALQAFFGLEDDPFVNPQQGREWRCRFKAIPERP